MATATLEREAKVLRHALQEGGDEVSVSLSRETAEFMARVMEARATGREVIVANATKEVTPAESAWMMGMSRPQVRKLMDTGQLPYRMVGTHHRISLTAIREFMAAEKVRRRAALKTYSNIQNELGLTE